MQKPWMAALAITTFFIFPLTAHALDTPAAKIDLQANEIEGIVTLPIKGMRAVQSKGQTVFLSDRPLCFHRTNIRFLVQNTA